MFFPDSTKAAKRNNTKDEIVLASLQNVAVREVLYSQDSFNKLGYTVFNDSKKKDVSLYTFFTYNQYSKILIIKTETGDVYLGPNDMNLTSFFANNTKRIHYAEIILQKKDYYNESILSLAKKILAQELDFDELVNISKLEEDNKNELFSKLIMTEDVNGNVFSSLFKSQVINYIDDICDTIDFNSVALNVRVMDGNDRTIFAKTMFIQNPLLVRSGTEMLFLRNSNKTLTLGLKDGSFMQKYNMLKNQNYYIQITTQCKLKK